MPDRPAGFGLATWFHCAPFQCTMSVSYAGHGNDVPTAHALVDDRTATPFKMSFAVGPPACGTGCCCHDPGPCSARPASTDPERYWPTAQALPPLVMPIPFSSLSIKAAAEADPAPAATTDSAVAVAMMVGARSRRSGRRRRRTGGLAARVCAPCASPGAWLVGGIALPPDVAEPRARFAPRIGAMPLRRHRSNYPNTTTGLP